MAENDAKKMNAFFGFFRNIGLSTYYAFAKNSRIEVASYWMNYAEDEKFDKMINDGGKFVKMLFKKLIPNVRVK